MKATSGALKSALQANSALQRCALYTFTLLSGTVLYFTDWGSSISFGGHTYLAPQLDSGPGLHVGKTRTAIGLQVDSTEVDMYYDTNTRISGVTPGAFANAGAFDGCTVKIDTLFMLPGSPGNTSLGIINRYTGIVDQVRVETSRVTMTVSSPVAMLSGAFPRNYALPQCNHALFDSGCTLTKASFAVAGTVASGTRTQNTFPSGVTNPDGYFTLGSVVWLTGANAGITSQVQGYLNAGGTFTLIYPLPVAPSVGDTFTAYPGCDKTRGTCNAKFSNLIHFRGYPYVPTPETIVLGSIASQVVDTSGGNAGPGGGGVGRGGGGQGGNFKQF